MSDPRPTSRPIDPRLNPAPGEEYAQDYSDGYAEGLREAFREILRHASRGHTAQELRLLIESRIAQIREDVEIKRKSLLIPPRTPIWGTRPRPPSTSAAELRTDLEVATALAGNSYLFFETRPNRAIACLLRSHTSFPRLIVISQHPPPLPGIPSQKVSVLRLGSPDLGHESESGVLGPGEIGGRVKSQMEDHSGALVYLDALEFLGTEYSL